MRALGRIVLALLAGLLVWGGWYMIGGIDFGAWFAPSRNNLKLELVPLSTASVGYPAPGNGWLSFSLAKGSTQIKLVSTANVRDLARAKQQHALDPMKRWAYTLEYEVLDGDGKRILHRLHHHRTNLGLYKLPDGREYTSSFYLSDELAPMNGVIVALNLAGLPAGEVFRVRLASRDADIASVLVRLYLPEKVADQKLAYLWQRLSDKQKESLAKGSVYSHDLLLESEKRNLLMTSWQPVGPRGIRGRDYQQEELYVLRDNDGESADEFIPPAGLLVDPVSAATIPIPANGGRIRLRFTPTLSPGPEAGQIKLVWYGTSAFRRAEKALVWSVREPEATLDLAGGLLEIRADREMTVRAFLDSGDKPAEITPPPIYLRTYLADGERPVSYAIHHADKRPTGFRVVFRSLAIPGSAAGERPNVIARYEIAGADGAILGNGRIAISREISPYERLLGDYSGNRVVEGAEYFFSLPKDVASIRFFAEEANGFDPPTPLLVSAQTRPAGIPREVRIPADFYDFGALGERIPGWFMVQPIDSEHLILNNRSRILSLQAQPARERPELLAGRFQWEDFRPTGQWLARTLLTPREPGFPDRPEALPGTFRRLPAGKESILDFPPYLGTREIAPTLAWINPQDEALAADILVDGRLHHRVKARGIHGEVQLPPLPAGQHRIEIRSDNHAEWLINHTPPRSDSLVQRLGLKLDSKLSFAVDRRNLCEEFVTLRLYQPFLQTSPSRLRIRVRPVNPPALEPLPGWLFEERVVEVSADRAFAAPVFDTRGQRSDAGQPIYLHFPAGWPRGRYHVDVSQLSGTSAWVSLSRLSLAPRPERRFLLETGVLRAAFNEN